MSLHRLGAAAGQLVTVDDALGRALAAEPGGQALVTIVSGIVRGERAGGQGDRAVEARHLLEAVDDAQHELRPQPERERADDALAIQLQDRHRGHRVTTAARRAM